MLTFQRFAIDRVPVTVRDYDIFVRETDHRSPGVTGDVRHDAHAWRNGVAPRAYLSHPVVLVSFADAAAYCAWRGARLPTLVERRTALGSRVYPWGDIADTTRANTAESTLGDTVPVATFPRAISPTGMMDTVGNVSEWTASPGTTPNDRVIAGSGFDEPITAGRADRHRTVSAFTRSVTLGFRCAMTRP